MPIIDRFEGDIAVWEGGSAPREQLPMAAREGDVLALDEAGQYYIDLEATQARRQEMARRLHGLFNRTRKG